MSNDERLAAVEADLRRILERMGALSGDGGIDGGMVGALSKDMSDAEIKIAALSAERDQLKSKLLTSALALLAVIVAAAFWIGWTTSNFSARLDSLAADVQQHHLSHEAP